MNVKKILSTFSLAVIATFSWGQNLTAATSEIHIDLNSGMVNTTSLPTVHWVSPGPEHTISQEDQIHLEAKINSSVPIKEVALILSDAGSGLAWSQKKISVPQGANDYHLDMHLTVPTGNLGIELMITNTDGAKVSGHRTVMVGADVIANAVLIDRKDYALIFATDKYDHWDDLVNPVNDAHSIATELESRYGFETEIVENPTMEEVWEKIRFYNERKFKPQDQLLVFFAGHGQFDDTFGEGYVVAKNSMANDKSKSTYISHNRLRGVVNNIPCEHIFLMMDVCFGGTFDPVLARSRSAMDEATDEELIVRKLSHKTRKYLTSGGKEYVSDGIAGGHSPFASKFIESLKSNGGTDAILTIAELQASMEKLKQLPRFGSFGEDEPLSDFIFIAR